MQLPAVGFEPGSSHTAVRHVTARPLRPAVVRYDDTTTHSTTTEVIEITIRLRYDYGPTTTYHARLLPFDASEKSTSIFRLSRVVVVSQSVVS